MNLTNYPRQETQLLFYKAYLTTANATLLQSLTASSNPHALDEFLQSLVDNGNLFALAAHMFWGLWAIVQAHHSTIDFDFLDYARMRFHAFEMQLDLFCPTAKDL
jgi:ethanolamine kinase